MNIRVLLLVSVAMSVAPHLFSQSNQPPEPPVPVTQAQPDTANKALLTPPAGENQRLYGPRYTALITPEAAQELSNKFRAVYGQATSPRIVIFVNRAVGDSPSGLKLTSRKETVHQTASVGMEPVATKTSNITSENSYEAKDVAKPTLADQQTVREIERLFGRVFRNAGAKLADASAAAALLGKDADVRLTGDEGAQEREALKQVADLAVEVLISSRDVTVTGVAGDATYAVPDIQVTAIRLNDAAILGQAASSDVLGHGGSAGQVARQFGVPDITEATAFALMEDMLTGSK